MDNGEPPRVPPKFEGDFQSSTADALPTKVPAAIGRYSIIKLLGKGGFGLVYLAHDNQLSRPVTVKVPHPNLVARPEDADLYLGEARTVASLEHAHIVPVYDVGSTPDFPFFVVSKYVEGSDLATRLKDSRLSWQQAAELGATVAEALHYAHKRGFVHRDVKPGNILIDNDGKAHVVDFGLALREENVGKGPKYAGTPAYMSPEQARGEGHRVDGRSDIFSLGVVLYELLVGRPPFRGDTQVELLEQITTQEPRPPRQCDDTIPKELERICLKALSKRATERYTTAHDLAEDLKHFLSEAPQAALPVRSPSRPSSDERATVVTTVASDTPPATPISDSPTTKIVPKGLRSFDAQDADFFLELLPGPRDRGGLPDSIRFWKTRIEQTDPDETFGVGLIYGPSGCGKSSFVKAGLLPRLAEHVLPVYVEATSDATETRLLHALRKRCPGLPNTLDLKESLATLRRGQGLPVGEKALIVLDQFEQWLHANKEEQNSELVHALRQCDGGRVQCIVMVRDDFWLAVSRFMRELEVRLVEGQNSALTDLFDSDHAKKVLAAFGRAFDKLSQKLGETSQEQKQFLEQAVNGLAQDGKVVCVRLALFAEMMKGKPWTPAALKEVGGTEGIGVTFLEETFSATTAPPEHRYHQKAARAVLKALLPGSGTDIKGNMRSYFELLEASGYADHPKDFEDLIRILDGELRLITPTDPEGVDPHAPSTKVEVGHQYYQLTHDYLVHSLRDWLTRKQKETRRGRAELRLAEWSVRWNAKPENRLLPSLWEYLDIRLLTDKKKWTSPQRKIMSRAGRFHGIRAGFLVLALVAVILVGFAVSARVQQHENRNYASALVQSLLAANTADVADLIREIDKYQEWANPLLREIINGKETTRRQKLHASLALLKDDPSQADYVFEQLLSAQVEEVPVIITLLRPHKDRVQQRLWGTVKSSTSGERLRAAAALAAYDSENAEWRNVGEDVVTSLVSVTPTEPKPWIIMLRPVGAQLVEPLQPRYRDRSPQRDSERPLAAAALADYLKDQPKALRELILQAENDREFLPFLESLRPQRSACVDEFKTILRRSPPPDDKPVLRDSFWRKQANAALCLLGFEERETVWPLLKHTENPSLRSFIIDRLARFGADYRLLADRLKIETDSSIRQALILALGDFGTGTISKHDRQTLVESLSVLYRSDPDPGVHSAAEWALRKCQADDRVARLDDTLQKTHVENDAKNRRWFINSQGQTFGVVDGPVNFLMGDKRRPATIAYRFAMATHEVTVEQFQKFRSAYQPLAKFAPQPDCPANMVSWYDSAAYCNWLCQQDDIPKDQWCYETNEKGNYAEGMKTSSNFKQRTGYRLPTDAEWEYVCRANTRTAFSFGDPEELLERYGWYMQNSRNRSWPVGRLRPNALGAFDMHGNDFEWCQDRLERESERRSSGSETVKRGSICVGGAFDVRPAEVRSDFHLFYATGRLGGNLGFRPARTYP